MSRNKLYKPVNYNIDHTTLLLVLQYDTNFMVHIKQSLHYQYE